MGNSHLSLQDFKNWLSTQKELSDFFNLGLSDQQDPNEKYMGKEVYTKVSESKLFERIETEDDAQILVAEFIENGGTVLSIEDKKIQIEVDSGSFYIPRFCVKIKKV